MLSWRRITAASAALLTIPLLLATPRAAHRAHLSLDLLSGGGVTGGQRQRVIIHDANGDASTIADRHHLQILRHLANGVVVLANADEVNGLSADGDVGGLSGDLPVRNSMTVSNASTGADQTRAGSPGLFGIGGIPGVTGQGVGVAVIDSGVSPHPA